MNIKSIKGWTRKAGTSQWTNTEFVHCRTIADAKLWCNENGYEYDNLYKA